MLAALAQYEWVLILAIILALGVWELISIRRTIRRSKPPET